MITGRKAYVSSLISMLALLLVSCRRADNHINDVILKKGSGERPSIVSDFAKNFMDRSVTTIYANEPEEPDYAEDETEGEYIYGANPGNIYNEGQYLEYLDGQYFLCTHLDENYIVDAPWGYFLEGVRMKDLNYYNGKLYGIHNDTDKAYDGCLMMLDVIRRNGTLYFNRKPEYLFAVNGKLVYNETNEHMLLCYDPEEDTETIVFDDGVYYPTVYENSVIFSNKNDGGCLYSVDINGKKAVKLTKREGRWPLVYEDKLYYLGVENGRSALYEAKTDGTEEKKLIDAYYDSPLILDGKYYFIEKSTPALISCLDLTKSIKELKQLDFSAEIYNKISSEVGNIGTYKLTKILNMGAVYDKVAFRTFLEDDYGNSFTDGSEFDTETDELSLTPMFDEQVSPSYSLMLESAGNMIELNEGGADILSLLAYPSNGHDYFAGLKIEDALKADAAALEIAEDIMSDSGYENERAMVSAATQRVKSYCDRARYGADKNGYYLKPYGVFVSGNYSSAGATRALGRVLDLMGIQWTHANEDTDTHQWCVVTMDGVTGYADAMIGKSDIGVWEDAFYIEDGLIWEKQEENK